MAAGQEERLGKRGWAEGGWVGRGGEPLAGAEDGRNAVELVTAIYKAGIERTVVDLPLSTDDPYYRAGHLVEAAPRFYEKRRSLAEAAAA